MVCDGFPGRWCRPRGSAEEGLHEHSGGRTRCVSHTRPERVLRQFIPFHITTYLLWIILELLLLHSGYLCMCKARSLKKANCFAQLLLVDGPWRSDSVRHSAVLLVCWVWKSSMFLGSAGGPAAAVLPIGFFCQEGKRWKLPWLK